MSIVSLLSSAIIRQEGANPLNNNPGNLMDLAYYKNTGEFRLAKYDTIDQGMAAMEQTINHYVTNGYTLEEMFAKYAPKGHGSNNPGIYADNVSSWTGIPKGVPLNTIETPISEVNPITAVNAANLSDMSNYADVSGGGGGSDPTNGITGTLGTIAVVGVGILLAKFIFS